MEGTMLKTMFGYVDEFGQEVKSEKTFDFEAFEDGMTMDFLLGEFKLFLLGAGYSAEQVAKIEYNE